MAQTSLGFFNMGDAKRVADPWEEELQRRRALELERMRVDEAVNARQQQGQISRQELAQRQRESMQRLGLDGARLGLDRDRMGLERDDMANKYAVEKRRLEQADLARAQQANESLLGHQRAQEMMGVERGHRLEDRGLDDAREERLWGRNTSRDDKLIAGEREHKKGVRTEDREEGRKDATTAWERADAAERRRLEMAEAARKAAAEAEALEAGRRQTRHEQSIGSNERIAEDGRGDRREARVEDKRRFELTYAEQQKQGAEAKAQAKKALVEGNFGAMMEGWKDKTEEPSEETVRDWTMRLRDLDTQDPEVAKVVRQRLIEMVRVQVQSSNARSWSPFNAEAAQARAANMGSRGIGSALGGLFGTFMDPLFNTTLSPGAEADAGERIINMLTNP